MSAENLVFQFIKSKSIIALRLDQDQSTDDSNGQTEQCMETFTKRS